MTARLPVRIKQFDISAGPEIPGPVYLNNDKEYNSDRSSTSTT
jgi:hypothetical protein